MAEGPHGDGPERDAERPGKKARPRSATVGPADEFIAPERRAGLKSSWLGVENVAEFTPQSPEIARQDTEPLRHSPHRQPVR